jgi:hypothetical protein
VIFGIVGLFCGIVYSFGGLLIDILVSLNWLSSEVMETPGLSYGTALAFGALIGMPIIFALAGFVLGIIEGIVYNLFSKWLFGIKIEFNP